MRCSLPIFVSISLLQSAATEQACNYIRKSYNSINWSVLDEQLIQCDGRPTEYYTVKDFAVTNENGEDVLSVDVAERDPEVTAQIFPHVFQTYSTLDGCPRPDEPIVTCVHSSPDRTHFVKMIKSEGTYQQNFFRILLVLLRSIDATNDWYLRDIPARVVVLHIPEEPQCVPFSAELAELRLAYRLANYPLIMLLSKIKAPRGTWYSTLTQDVGVALPFFYFRYQRDTEFRQFLSSTVTSYADRSYCSVFTVVQMENSEACALEIMLLQDSTHSFTNNRAALEEHWVEMFGSLPNDCVISTGVASFGDKPLDPFNVEEGKCYTLQQPLTRNTEDSEHNLPPHRMSGGQDFQEFQLGALISVALDPRVMWTSGVGQRATSLSTVHLSLNNAGARKVIILTTDSTWHVQSDMQKQLRASETLPQTFGYNFNYGDQVSDEESCHKLEYASIKQTADILAGQGIRLVFLVPEVVKADYMQLRRDMQNANPRLLVSVVKMASPTATS